MKKDINSNVEQVTQKNETEHSEISPNPKKTMLLVGIVLSAIVILVVATIIFWPKKSTKSNIDVPQEQAQQSTSSSKQTNSTQKLIIGDANAKVSIIEYGDFKCPLCGRFFRETEPQIKKEYIDSGKANIEYRPLPIIAQDSSVAALGAYCSNEQSKFEQYHSAVFNYIYDNHYSKSLKDEFSNIFTLETLTKIANEQGLDTQAFNACMTSNRYSSAIEASEAQAKADGASSTPTIIIGGKKVVGAQPFAIYKALIEAQLR